MRQLLIDDFRTFDMIDSDGRYARPHEGAEREHALTFSDGIGLLDWGGPWDLLYLDHDLESEDPKETGCGIMCWLEQHQNPRQMPKEIVFVTDNPVGREAMQRVLDSIRARSR